MASEMPIRVDRGTPTPPPEDENQTVNSATEGTGVHIFNSDTLSPLSANFPGKVQYASFGSMSPPKASPAMPSSAASSLSPYSPMFSENGSDTAASSENKNPFNFKPVPYSPGGPVQTKADLGRRRGHKYKHSSVSHQIFLEPEPKTPLSLPTSLPIPTFKEFRTSMSGDQKLRMLWCFCHLLISGYVQWSGHGSLAMTALSHLLFFDAIGAFLCVAVDIGGNFEVWKRSSIRYPFGLERAEVLAGLAMSIGVLFMGLDLISHNLQHSLENVGGHEPHHHTANPYHERVPSGSVDFAALAAIGATLVSASVLKNHERMGRALRFNLPLPSLLSNPTHLLTLSCSTLMLLLPLFSFKLYKSVDAGLSVLIAALMFALGARLCYALGRMLLMSYPGAPGGAGDVVAKIEEDGAVSSVDEARFWQITLRDMGERNEDEINKLRAKIGNMVRNRLGGGYGGGRGGVKWEVSTQISFDGGGHGHSHARTHVHPHTHA
ncbi:hypothetical protein NA57DRAFT_66876 [Rhizodiscina lignyota]|uniref:Cation efflux protein transmembrane domain-containing protein n=1 Tax=Rhizodiscina lignyota TaxID=1504668 RepID=A0A9P4M8X7_9PEZI|nr:hypothetical protein NA57DRAFT_66876 [Rhizodiscina lignyota]